MKNSDQSNQPNMEKIFGFMQKLQTTKTDDQAEELKKEMDSFMQSELGLDMTDLNQQIDELNINIKETNSKSE